MDASGREISVGGDIIAPTSNKSNVGQKKGIPMNSNPVLKKEVDDQGREVVTALKDCTVSLEGEGKVEVEGKTYNVEFDTKPMEGGVEVTANAVPSVAASETVDSLTFSNGNDTLKIVLIKKHNRMFRLQMFLNENIEIRNNTFNGASQAYNYWDLLKNSLNKK